MGYRRYLKQCLLTVNIKEEGGTAILPNPIAENKEDINDEERLQWKIAGKFVVVNRSRMHLKKL